LGCLHFRAFDQIQRGTLSETLNISLDDRAWLQASLPVHWGVNTPPVRGIEDLAPSAFLASAYLARPLVLTILPPHRNVKL